MYPHPPPTLTIADPPPFTHTHTHHHPLTLTTAIIEAVDTGEELDKFPAHGAPEGQVSKAPLWKRIIWEGGFPLDGFLTAASAQVSARTRHR